MQKEIPEVVRWAQPAGVGIAYASPAQGLTAYLARWYDKASGENYVHR